MREDLRHAAVPVEQFLAAHGDAWVGLTNLQLRGEDRAELGITVVTRPHRRQGLARALKLLALRHARERGVLRARTENHERNAAMLALNQALGFCEASSGAEPDAARQGRPRGA